MMPAQLSKQQMKYLIKFQRMEITERYLYLAVAKKAARKKENRDMILGIAEEELKHYNIWKKYSQQDVAPNYLTVFLGSLFTFIVGYVFMLKWMEKRADALFTEKNLSLLAPVIPEVELVIMKDEHRHESEILSLVDREALRFVGSIVLGLNDALVEMIGSLAGFTFAYQDAKLIAVTGFITGVAASLSMAASEYLSLKSEGRPDAMTASIFTGAAYIIVVLLLITPYILMPHHVYFALAMMVCTVLFIILMFNYYMAVVQSTPLWPRFLEMAMISLSVAGISFIIGILAKILWHIDI